MEKRPRELDLVLASPGDVQAERDCVPRVVDELNGAFGRLLNLRLNLHRWETDAYPGFHAEGPQGLIDSVLHIENCDILIGVFWNRIGTPTKKGPTGTEHEILKAWKASRSSGTPHLMLYFSEAHSSLKTKEETDQRARVLAFREKLRKSQEFLLWKYDGEASFEEQLRKNLQHYLTNRYGPQTPLELQSSREARAMEEPSKLPSRWTSETVKEGVGKKTRSISPPAAVRPVQLVTPALKDTLAFALNVELRSPGEQQTASTVGVPSVAVNGQVVFYTGNWYAAVSTDGGQTFSYVNPAESFAAMDPPGAHFCCNQVVHYISQIDVFVWLLQYTSSTRDNFLRLAFAKTRDVILGRWRIYDINSELLSLKAAYLTSPDLAVGANYLYVTANVHGDEPLGTAIVRCPFNGIESGEITAEHFVSTHVHSFRMAQNCSTTAFFAAHETTSSMLVFSWEESQGKPTATTVNVATWIGGSGYESQTPDGRRWLDRIDPRITGATLAGDELWFAWTVDKGTDHRRHPFVRIARISCRGMKLIENMDVFEEHSAVCYPALSTNATSEVGMACVMGGGPRFPSHVVGILTGTRQEVLVAAGDRGPVPDPHTGRGEWGTFLTIRPVLPDRRLFAATGYTLKGKKDGKNRDATPRLVIFGRAGDIMPALSVVGAIGTVRGAGRIHRNGDRRDRR